MTNIKLGDKVYEGVTSVKLDTAEGGTKVFAPYEEAFSAGKAEGYEQGKEEAIENLPTPYLKIDPNWNSLAFFAAYGRSSLLKSIKYNDTANVTSFQNFCANWLLTDLTVVPSFDCSNGTNFSGMFNWGGYIKEIGELNIPKATDVTNMFNYCTDLERISFVKNCIPISISFSYSSKLDDASIQSIIDGLADLTGLASQTLTFHATVGAKLTEAQRAAITAKNWTLVY